MARLLARVRFRASRVRHRSASSISTAPEASLALAGTVLAASFGNGSFETGGYVDSGGGFMGDATGTVIDGWTITGAVDWIGTYWTAPVGTKSIDMNATPTQGTLSQTFDTTVNATYVVTFKMSGNPNCGIENKTLTVQATGGALTTFTFVMPAGATNGNMTWDDNAYTFKATATSTTLSFASTTFGACGAAIDAVTITETLPTGALCKNGGWQTMVDKLSNPFKNQGDCVSYYATGEKNLASVTN